MAHFLELVMQWLALPQNGLSTVFVVSFISATLLPLGSEPAVYGLVVLRPDLFWPVILVATLGNTLGGGVSWWMGLGASHAVHHVRKGNRIELRALSWLNKFGAKACFFAFLPAIGDPLCAVAGWLKLPFWPCLGWMAVGKFLRYELMTALLLWAVPDGWLSKLLHMAG